MRFPTFRRHYAALFNTDDERVRYYDELTDSQRQFANATFSGVDMAQHVYNVSGNSVICRRRLHKNDPAVA